MPTEEAVWMCVAGSQGRGGCGDLTSPHQHLVSRAWAFETRRALLCAAWTTDGMGAMAACADPVPS